MALSFDRRHELAIANIRAFAFSLGELHSNGAEQLRLPGRIYGNGQVSGFVWWIFDMVQLA